MKKLLLLSIVNVLLLSLISLTFVMATEGEIFKEAEKIIQQKISCNELNDYQLEILGDYYMEQMHPGELHEIMDERMGGESSDLLRQVHMNMGKMFYCGEQRAMPMGMMNMMMGRGNYGMMGGYPLSYYGSANSHGFIFNVLFFLIIIILAIALIILLIKSLSKSERRK